VALAIAAYQATEAIFGFPGIVSSGLGRRNNSAREETIFHLLRRTEETADGYQSATKRLIAPIPRDCRQG
jgi:hypothetical protein